MELGAIRSMTGINCLESLAYLESNQRSTMELFLVVNG